MTEMHLDTGGRNGDSVVNEIYSVVTTCVPSADERKLEIGTDLFQWGLDSMGIISIIVALEERFGCQFDLEDLELERFGTIENIANIVRSKLA